MLARLFNQQSIHDHNHGISTFHSAYEGLSTAFALCDGLELIAWNTAFQNLFGISSDQRRSVFINRLLGDQGSIERLFAYPNETVELTKPEQVAMRVQLWPIHPGFWLLECEDNRRIHRLLTQAEQARSYDASTGTLLIGAFNAKLHSLLRQMERSGETGLFFKVRFAAFDNRLSGLTSEDRNEFILEFAQRLKDELGSDCLIGRQDTLALSIFVRTEQEVDETRHILNQARRLGVSSLKKLRTSLCLRCASSEFPGDANSVAQLHSFADLAMEDAVSSGGRLFANTVSFSGDLLNRKTTAEQLAQDMPCALANNEIAPHFQPVVDPSSGAILSFEALIRWHHPQLGPIAPPKIIEVAQQNGLLTQLTAATMRCTAEQAKNWPKHVQFAVNVTPKQLNSELVDLVRDTVRDAGIDPGRLEIEVTEDALIEDFKTSARIFARLRAVGATIAMDDFGVGYTSIGNLRTLEFDKIKIDKSISDGLPRDPRSRAIVRSLMFLADELGLKVTVEGIEHENQLEFLRVFNCGIQGYVFSPALPPGQLPELARCMIAIPRIEAENKAQSISNETSKSIQSG